MTHGPPSDLSALWRVVLAEIELSVSKANFTIWFKNTALASRGGETVTVTAPNIFTREWLENKYHPVILAALQRIDPTIQNVRYEIVTPPAPVVHPVQGSTVVITKRALVDGVGPATPAPRAVVEDPARRAPVRMRASESEGDLVAPGTAPVGETTTGLNSRYTFENFIVGANNELAYAAAQAVARRPGEAYNPLFIYGGTGLGKTHLLQAIGNATSTRTALRVRYAALEKFMHELIDAIRTKATTSFKERYRSVDVLLVDDVQAIIGKDKTQDEFFHTFNELHGAGKQIVISSDRPPKAFAALEERLRSRFEGGMIADIGPPDLETRIAILKQKCALRGIRVSEEALTFIAAEVTRNIRELEGCLNRLLAHCELLRRSPDLPTTKEVLADVLAKPKRRIIQTDRIIEAVSAYYHLRPGELIGESRRKEVVLPRQVAMYLLRNENGFSYPTIGQSFGGKDHTTVMHACEKIRDILEMNEELRRDVLTIKQQLYVLAEA